MPAKRNLTLTRAASDGIYAAPVMDRPAIFQVIRSLQTANSTMFHYGFTPLVAGLRTTMTAAGHVITYKPSTRQIVNVV
jgi:hypothetical protein